ncbi:unnamed protein product [Calypogeia fissa]
MSQTVRPLRWFTLHLVDLHGIGEPIGRWCNDIASYGTDRPCNRCGSIYRTGMAYKERICQRMEMNFQAQIQIR